jgi:hypothetical protein
MPRISTILYIDNSYTFGGVINSLRNLINAIDKENFEPHIWMPAKIIIQPGSAGLLCANTYNELMQTIIRVSHIFLSVEYECNC